MKEHTKKWILTKSSGHKQDGKDVGMDRAGGALHYEHVHLLRVDASDKASIHPTYNNEGLRSLWWTKEEVAKIVAPIFGGPAKGETWSS